jgi:hypothetical protein
VGKNDCGSSTVSSCVPVSCPDAAGTGVIDTVGAAAAVVGAAAAEDEDDGVWYGTPLVAHPVSATAATAVTPARTRETDDTALASPQSGHQHLTRYRSVSTARTWRATRTWIMTLEHRRWPTSASG